jgi:hypothetical protein
MQNDQLLSGVLPAAAPTQPVIVQQNPPATVDYTLGMSPVMRMFAQFGFAGLAAVLVIIMYRDISRDSREMREMYRDEADRNRIELRAMSEAADKRNDAADRRNNEIANRLTSLTFELSRATDVLRSAGLKLEQSVTGAKPPTENDEHGSTAPMPRAKTSVTGSGPGEPP